MEIRVQIEGVDAAIRELDNLVRESTLREALRAAATFVEGQVKVSMTEPKTGAIYVRQGRAHQASAPGQAPAIDFGFLANSIQVGEVTAREATVVAGAEYALYLEMGTRFMSPRPFMRPALEGNRERIRQIILEAVQRRAGR